MKQEKADFLPHMSQHPFRPYNIKNAKKLIIGSIPPHRFSEPKNLLCGDIDWYYGSKNNAFWDILKQSCGDIEAKICTRKRQKGFLKNYKIGIFDMVHRCARKNNHSASDSDLRKIKSVDACKIIKNNKNLHLQLFFTSQFAANLFCKQTGCKIDLKIKKKQRVALHNKIIDIIILYSPSPSWSRGYPDIRKHPNKNEMRQTQYQQIFTT
ncbi:MAG: hypothetical protein IBX45_07695 [Campylobacterales bacterium]|nr:hypothetical protein [Campylobacterales bacterium]